MHAVPFENHVRESAADIDGQPDASRHSLILSKIPVVSMAAISGTGPLVLKSS